MTHDKTVVLKVDDDAPMASKIIDATLSTVSWAFLPLILLLGLSLAVVAGRTTLPIRVGSPPDPLDFPTTRVACAEPRHTRIHAADRLPLHSLGGIALSHVYKAPLRPLTPMPRAHLV